MAMSTIDPEIFNRRHPSYDGLVDHWQFLEETYHGGRSWFDTNIFKYMREGDGEFTDRMKRAYRFNHTREVVDLVTKYVFKAEINRAEDAPDVVKSFWDSATRGGESIDVLMRQVDRAISVYGQPYIVVDNTVSIPEGQRKLTKRQMKNMKGRCYAYVLRPQDALDMAYDEHGDLIWFLAHEVRRDDADFFKKDHQEYSCYRLWTRTHSYLYQVKKATGAGEGSNVSMRTVSSDATKFRPSSMPREVKGRWVVEELQAVEHNLGIVPVFPVRDRESDSPYNAPGLIDDIAYLDRAVANYLSNLDAIIQDQTFSTLTIPIQSLEYGDDSYQKILELGTNRIFAFDAEGGAGPAYISPDPAPGRDHSGGDHQDHHRDLPFDRHGRRAHQDGQRRGHRQLVWRGQSL